MKLLKNLLFLLTFILLGTFSAMAEIYVDIDSGNIDPVSIAIMDFGADDVDNKEEVTTEVQNTEMCSSTCDVAMETCSSQSHDACGDGLLTL